MTRPEVFGLLLALCCVLITAEKPYCAWYGECGATIIKDRFVKRTCVAHDITAQPINNVAAEIILKKRCPHFFKNNGLYHACIEAHSRNSLEDL